MPSAWRAARSTPKRPVERSRFDGCGPNTDGGVAVEVPISSGDVGFGILAASRPALAEFPSEDRRLLESAASQIAVGLERARLDAEVAAARLDAETSQARAALFSSVTHDLRTPLASIKTAVTSLLQVDVRFDRVQAQGLLQTVLEETDRLNRLVGNILGLAQVRSGALQPVKELTAVDEIVESVLHRLEPTFGSVRVRTILRDAPDVPVDPVLIDQVVSNLLENAVRFSPPAGEVTVSVGPWRSAVQGSGGGSGAGDSAGGSRSHVRALHPARVDRSGRDGRQRSRAGHLPGDRARARWPDLDRGHPRRWHRGRVRAPGP